MLVNLYDVLAVVGMAVDGGVRMLRKSGSGTGGISPRREPRAALSKEVL
jgi:hypothetical protein